MGLLMPSTPHNISGRCVGFGLVAVRHAFLVSGLQAFEQALRLLHVPLNHAPVQNAQEVSPARKPPSEGLRRRDAELVQLGSQPSIGEWSVEGTKLVLRSGLTEDRVEYAVEHNADGTELTRTD